MKIITLEEFLRKKQTELVVVEVSCLEEAKQIEKTEQLFGVILSGSFPARTIDFALTKCSCLEEHKDIQEKITKGNIFIRTKDTKIKYFLPSNNQQVVAKSFEKKISDPWKNFYLETLSQVFSPEA